VAESSKAGSKRPLGEDVEAPKAAKVAKTSNAAGTREVKAQYCAEVGAKFYVSVL
jgi:hypothetical protein